jgi:hypothetical protein
MAALRDSLLTSNSNLLNKMSDIVVFPVLNVVTHSYGKGRYVDTGVLKFHPSGVPIH